MNIESRSTVQWRPPERGRLRQAVLQFKAAWQEGRRPELERFLEEAGPDERATWLWDLLSVEIDLRLAAQEKPAPQEYEARFSAHVALVTALFSQKGLSLPGRIGRYQVAKRLGGGGFGHVYLCFDDRARRQVAIKVPRADRFTSAEAREAFLREARNVARLDHPNIVPLYDFGEEPGQCFLVYKYIEGPSLQEQMSGGALAPGRAGAIVALIADALQHAHGKNLFHRDIKPANILIDVHDRPYVTDFGLAVPEDELWQTRGHRSGTLLYMSPEQIRGEGHRIDGRTDIYSLGVLFYEMLTGRRPFTGSDDEIIDKIVLQDPRPPRQIREGIPKEFERICMRAMAKQMSARHPAARDLAEELREALGWLNMGGGSAFDPAGKPGGADRPSAGSSRQGLPVVPKGLRSYGPEDSDFFLQLLPGLRDRDGLPDSLAFWKVRAESREQTFTVGLLYGPSGCGKSSFVKAGLLPRLPESVLPVYLEATGRDTERMLLAGLCKALPEIDSTLSLVEVLFHLRRGRWLPKDKKVLIVVDQFEQWLHGHGTDMGTSELLTALRHADGSHVSVLLLARDDFWMGVSRLFDLLEINLDREHNARAVDLFDQRHAQKVLTQFGQAFERLSIGGEPGDDEKQFIDRAVQQLSQDGRVIPVRLSLFADLMKDRPWTTASLAEVGGAEGVGVRFLEETFSGRTALPDLRVLEKPVRALLQALLPEQGSDIKGGLRSREELARACGLEEASPRFRRVLEILDRELHIITPTEAASGSSASPVLLYQLTHDYMVPALRQWLTDERKRTWQGRAQLLLEERASQWRRSKDRRFLPSTMEFAQIALGVPRSRRSPSERQYMRSARRHQTARLCALGMALVAILLGGLAVYHAVGVRQGHDLVAYLMGVETSQAPEVIDQLKPHYRQVQAELNQIAQDEQAPAKKRLHASLALLPIDATQLDYLKQRALSAEGKELGVLRQALGPYKPSLVEWLWTHALDGRQRTGERFRAGALLAALDSRNPRWESVKPDLADILVAQSPVSAEAWVTLFRPVRHILTEPLRSIYLNDKRPEQRYMAALVLTEFLDEQPLELTKLVASGDDRQIGVLCVRLRRSLDQAVRALQEDLREPGPGLSEPAGEEWALRQTNRALGLLCLKPDDLAWGCLRQSPDPRVRTGVMHRLVTVGVDANVVLERLTKERDASIRRALLLALGEFVEVKLPAALEQAVAETALALYRKEEDPGAHAAAGWLLRKLGRDGAVAMVASTAKNWAVNSQGQKFVFFLKPMTFTPAIPPTATERPTGKSITLERSFALAAHEVTIDQFRRFQPTPRKEEQYRGEPTCPVTLVGMDDVASYCNWLSRQEGIPESQWSYKWSEKDKEMRPVPGFLSSKGYRLPTEQEWEFACAGGVLTSRFFGHAGTYLERFAWYTVNADSRFHPVGLLKPNDFGLFDIYGNVGEWCEPAPNSAGEVERSGRKGIILGGSIVERTATLWTGTRIVTTRGHQEFAGFRLARTLD